MEAIAICGSWQVGRVNARNVGFANPIWKRDELILALELFLKVRPRIPGPEENDIIALSALLNQLPIHPRTEFTGTFRNPNGVSMKLANFRRFDSSHTGAGLARGNMLEEEIWKEFAADPERLCDTANAIRSGSAHVAPPATKEEGEQEEEEEFSEGRILTALHKKRERHLGLVRKKKAETLQRLGRLSCEVCSFDFIEKYGELGTGFAECHHTKPVSELRQDGKTKLKDLAIVCANCHRMLHKCRPLASITQLREVIQLVTRAIRHT